MNFWKENRDHIYVAAHRSNSATHPENTVEAFQAAIAERVDQIETDVRVTRDGELVLIHDATVDRTTNGTGKVIDMTLSELKTLDAGSHKDARFAGAQIPTLVELMELVKDHPTMTLDLELKEYPNGDHEAIAFDVCDRVLETVDRYNFTDRVVINSFSGKLNEYVYKKHGKKYRQHVYFPVSHLGTTMIDPYSYAFCCCMFSSSGDIMAPPEECAAMAARGVEPWVSAGVKNEEGVDKMIACGATLVTCNNPDEILRLLRKKGKRQD